MNEVIRNGIDLAPKNENSALYIIKGEINEHMFAENYEAWMSILRSERIRQATNKINPYTLITLWSGDYMYLYKKYVGNILRPVAFVKSEKGNF